MNFLEIAKRVRQECGISGDGPSNVAGQVGVYAKIVAWVRSAYEEIEQHHVHWNFDWAMTQQPLLAGKEFYDPANDWGLDFKALASDGLFVYRAADGAAAKTWVAVVDWAMLRQLRTPGATGVPAYAAMAPDERLCFYPTPAAGWVATLEYWRRPQALVANTDIPRLPARFHMAIVWRAVMFWCAHDENPALWQSANQNYRELLNKMTITELPQMAQAEPLV